MLNRATVASGIPVADVGSSLKGEIIAKLPDDAPLVLRAINEGVPFVQSSPGSALSQEIIKLAGWITRDGVAATEDDGAALVPAAGKFSRWIRPVVRKRTG